MPDGREHGHVESAFGDQDLRGVDLDAGDRAQQLDDLRVWGEHELDPVAEVLEECELRYSPPFGSAKDPINFAGMVAADVLRGDMPVSHWDSAQDGFLLDVREP